MTEALEGVVVGLPTVEKDVCPICEKPPHPDRTTTEKQEGNGCLDSIPKNLGCSQIGPEPGLPNFATAAHHLIPVNQCLKAFPRLQQVCRTVGYDVNNGNNGLPLPTCGQGTLNAYSTSQGTTVKYGKLGDDDKRNAAFVIMQGLNRQWHVGHHDWRMDYDTDGEPHPENYDKLVKVKLRDLEKDIQQEGDIICEPPDESESGKVILTELDALSGEIKGNVVAWCDYYVSALSCLFAMKYRR